MTKRAFALILCCCLLLGLVPGTQAAPLREPNQSYSPDQCGHILRMDMAPAALRPGFTGKLIELTPQRVEDTFDYLNEFYVTEHPEAALVLDESTPGDREAIAELARQITAECATDREKADAINTWLRPALKNLTYDEGASAYTNDTFYLRTGNCLSYANFMRSLLRCVGIPAVVGDGWRGDMENETVDLFRYVGHAWCFAYLDGEWVLYDPLWLSSGTTDRAYIAQNIYLDQVEMVTPASDEDRLPPVAYDRIKVYHTDGISYIYSESRDDVTVFTSSINNQTVQFVGSQDVDGTSDNWEYVDRSDAGMRRGEVYRNGWVSYRGYVPTYAHANGTMIEGAIMEYDGQTLYMNGSESWPLMASARDCTIQYGNLSFRPGYHGPCVDFPWNGVYVEDEWGDTYHSEWKSLTPEIASVDEHGIITCHTEGVAIIQAQAIRDLDGFVMAARKLTIQVSPEHRHPHDEDVFHHYLHEVFPSTCTQQGYVQLTCEHCGHSYQDFFSAALGHDYVMTTTDPTCTQRGYTTNTCSRCGDSFVDSFVNAYDHDWDYGAITIDPTPKESGAIVFTCRGCGETRTEVLKPHSHNYVMKGVFQPTCTREGYVLYACTGGSHAYYENVVPAKGHHYEPTEVREPACTIHGHTAYTCTDCGDSYFGDYLEPRGHVYSLDYVVEPTCLQEGYTHYVCNDCRHCYAGEFTDPTGHSHLLSTVVRPTCTKQGYTHYTCEDCGHTFDRAYTDPLGHDWNGSACSRCGIVHDSPFTDVDLTQWYGTPIFWAVEKEITNGITATTFGPDGICTRAQIVTFLWRAEERPEPGSSRNPFADVKNGEWYTKPVLWALEQGITTGATAATFGTENPCERAAVVTFLWRTFGCPEPTTTKHPFTDADANAWYGKAMLWAVENGITTGTSATTFGPTEACTRAQIVTFLYRAFN